MQTVYNIEEARVWFMNNSDGPVICDNGYESGEIDCYPDASKFFDA